MIRKGAWIIVLGVLFMGCKAKKRTTYGNGKKGQSAKTIKTGKAQKADDGLYPLPEDTGKFVRFEISSISEYIETFSEIAQFEMKAYGIPASITLAQGLLESGFGRGELAKKTNNHFGIKCHTGWQGDYDFHDDDERGECFRKYNHPMYSYRDHSIFLANRSRYAFLFNLPPNDYKRWAKGLKQAGYATDKRYPQKLIQLIEQHRLHKYDRAVIRKGYDKKEVVEVPQRNIYIVKKGDTLYSISRRYLVSVDELKRWNGIRGNTISIGQELAIKSTQINK
ncbi:glucosaminidase domain-containing protein [Ulvibacterium sp.]|uniref:glucosaminidase domain-containing protein n=1 Tax=Ulvibacterium sp. TaxID=2665914 RepID=UPI003CC5C0FE